MKQHEICCQSIARRACDCYLSRAEGPPQSVYLGSEDRAVCPWCGERLEMHQMDFKPEEGDDYECQSCQRTFTLKSVRCMAVISTAKKQ